jgi:Uma2 family endonuclease
MSIAVPKRKRPFHTPVLPAAAPIMERVHHFTVAQYERMTETGVITHRDRVELLEGVIVDKMTQHPPHNAMIDLARHALAPLLPTAWLCREQKAVCLTDSEPEPDLVVARGPMERYMHRHPTTQDIALVIQVADSSLSEDRDRKGRLYSRARLPVYWIINLIDVQIEVYTEPKGGRAPAYRRRQEYGRAEAVPLWIEGREIGRLPVSDIFRGYGEGEPTA